MLLTETSEFKEIAGFAKALAFASDKTDLSPLVFLVGTLLAVQQGVKFELPDDFSSINNKALEKAKSESLKVDGVTEPVNDKKIPLDNELKKIISAGQGQDIAHLIVALAKHLKLVDTSKNNKSEPVALDKVVEDPVFLTLNKYVQAIAGIYGVKEITNPEIYAFGALIALKKGELTHRPALSAHISAYSREFSAWLNEQGWHEFEVIDTQPYSPSEDTEQLIAPLKAFKDARDPLTALLNAGIDKVSQTRNRECVAYHEAGHAIVSLVLRPKVQIERVTIVPGEQYDGGVFFDDTNPIYKHVFPCTREDFLEDLCVALAGQAAQLKKYGFNAADIGAHSDFAGATEYAWQYITEFGLDDSFGPVQLSVLSKKYSIRSGWLFDEAQRRLQSLLKDAQKKTEILLEEHWDSVERVVKALVDKKTLTEDEVRSLIFPA